MCCSRSSAFGWSTSLRVNLLCQRISLPGSNPLVTTGLVLCSFITKQLFSSKMNINVAWDSVHCLCVLWTVQNLVLFAVFWFCNIRKPFCFQHPFALSCRALRPHNAFGIRWMMCFSGGWWRQYFRHFSLNSFWLWSLRAMVESGEMKTGF